MDTGRRLRDKKMYAANVSIWVKFHDFTQITRSISHSTPLSELKDILPLAKKLLKETDYAQHPVRLLGLSVSNPESEKTRNEWIQLTLDFK